MATASANLNLDGTADYLDFGDTDTYDFGTGEDFAVGAWVYPESSSTQYIFSNDNYGFNLSSGEALETRVFGSTTNTSSVTVTLNAWNFVCMNWDIGTDNDFYVISATGGLTSDAANGHTGVPSTSSNTNVVGIRGNLSEGEFDGKIQHLQVWNRLLSVNEFFSAAFSPGSVTNGLIGYLPIYGQLATEPDLSNLGANLTPTDSPPTSNQATVLTIPQQCIIT